MKIIFLLSLLSLIACNDKKTEKKSEYESVADSIAVAIEADKMVNDLMKSINYDTVGVSEAPVKVTKSQIVKKDYGNKSIRLQYKNVSDKKISAIRFKWYGENAFGEPANMGTSITEGFGGGYDDGGLSPNKTKSATWDLSSTDGKKVVMVWPTEVVFEDGTKWESGKNL